MVARMLAATHLAVWSDAALRKHELDKMRRRNPEWDFMSRTYFVLALVNMALRDPEYLAEARDIIDAIIENTLEVERESGFEHFLMSYGHGEGWVHQPPRSLFVDGEIALMLAARRILEEKHSYKPLLTERVEEMVSRMAKSPVLCAESYPDESWLFCNTVALAAIRMADVLDGTDHSAFILSWVNTAKERLIDSKTGLLVSAFGVDGTPSPSGFGPEGSTIWMASHMLQIVDEGFAEDQYQRARRELGRSFLGFGYSREWPVGVEDSVDVDSGPVIPVLGASASASGLAIIAAAAFDDVEYLRALLTSLEFAGFAHKRQGRLRYQSSNQVGDAVILYAMTEGPLWDLVRTRMNQ
ncbi:MAG: hypothetical protein GTO24_00080 [candidate division Zixibacteria bacterium]|nr:hypothetical protein [candidate division Zixibacteria bacterium]